MFQAVPVATHNQRGIGTLHVGCPEACDAAVEAADLLAIVESLDELRDLRADEAPDEVEVVEKAHRRPRFVEDCVREMVRGWPPSATRTLGDQRVHLGPPGEPRDDPQAQRGGRAPRPVADLTREIATGEREGHHVTAREWLEGV